MKRAIYFLISVFVLGLGLSLQSCKDDDDDRANCALNASISSPGENLEYASGEEIPLTLTFSACTPIQNYLVSIRNRNTDQLVFILSEFANSETIQVNTSAILDVAELTNMDVEIRAEDSEGNQIEEVLSTFRLLPQRGNILTLRFNLTYEGEILDMGQLYDYPTGEQFEFTRFDMYMSNLRLQTTNGNELMLREVDYLEMTDTYRDEVLAEDGHLYSVAGIEAGDFESLHFNIGLSPQMNETTPSDYPVSHPLGRSGDYWDGEGWMSYIFASIEGRMNIDTSNPDLEEGIALHLGSNNALQEITMGTPFSFEEEDGSREVIEINIDLIDLFIGDNGDIYDIVTTPSTHSLEQIPQVITLSNNLKNSINK